MAQTGKCSNRVGCTLAYTGQEIRFEGSPVCPECGQPLTGVTTSKSSGKIWLLILIPIVLLAMAGVGFYLVERLTSNDSKTNASASATVSATATTSATVAATATPATTVASATPTPTPAATETPANNQGNPPNGQGSPQGSPNGQGSPNANGSPQPSGSVSGGNNSGQAVNTKPTQLSAAEIAATKQEVLTRISAMPGMSASEKSKLTDKVETAKSMKRLTVINFGTGSAELPRPAVDQLVTLFKSQDIQEEMSDPTLVFIVAGYADTSGDPAGNIRLSEARAQAVSNVMSTNAGVNNLIRTVGMGGTELLGNRRPDQNRAVEIWAVLP
jgi:outer membrane protein OmpA-like peptidoglycan-associated protein